MQAKKLDRSYSVNKLTKMTNPLSDYHENCKHLQRITVLDCMLISAFYPFKVLMVDSLKKALEVIEKSAATIPREKKVLEEKSKQQQQQAEEKQKPK